MGTGSIHIIACFLISVIGIVPNVSIPPIVSIKVWSLIQLQTDCLTLTLPFCKYDKVEISIAKIKFSLMIAERKKEKHPQRYLLCINKYCWYPHNFSYCISSFVNFIVSITFFWNIKEKRRLNDITSFELR